MVSFSLIINLSRFREGLPAKGDGGDWLLLSGKGEIEGISGGAGRRRRGVKRDDKSIKYIREPVFSDLDDVTT